MRKGEGGVCVNTVRKLREHRTKTTRKHTFSVYKVWDKQSKSGDVFCASVHNPKSLIGICAKIVGLLREAVSHRKSRSGLRRKKQTVKPHPKICCYNINRHTCNCTFVGLMADIVLIPIGQVGSFLFPSNGLGRYKSNRVEKGGRTAF